MKINVRPPTLPSSPTEVRVPSPNAPAGLPVPVPNVGGSSFQSVGQDERRYSVRFLNGIEPRLKLAGVSAEGAQEFKRLFAAMNRSTLDREGRVVDTILASSHPREGMALYGLLQRLGGAVTPGGFKVEPNAQKSWTVTPPQGEPFVFGAKGQKHLTLGDGTRLELQSPGKLQVGDQTIDRGRAERVAMLSATVMVVVVAAVATIVTFGAAAPLIFALAAGLAHASGKGGVPREELDRLVNGALGSKGGLAQLQQAQGDALGPAAQQSLASLLSGAAGISALLGGPAAVHDALHGLMGKAGKSAAPSRSSDPELEKAAALILGGGYVRELLNPKLADGALKKLSSFAQSIRGRSHGEIRDAIAEQLRRFEASGANERAQGTYGDAAANGRITRAEARQLETAKKNVGRLGDELQRLRAQDSRTREG